MKKVAILQSNYIPWKGYFDIINMVDEFVIFDTAQYTKRDWRNRNRIKTPDGAMWLTIPVQSKHSRQTIEQTQVSGNEWAEKHWHSITRSYGRAPHYGAWRDDVHSLYEHAATLTKLSDINRFFICGICKTLQINTKISRSSDYQLLDGKTQKVLGICQQSGASTYVTGPAAKAYIDEELFDEAGISIEWVDYSDYPPYAQRFLPFDGNVSILDLIMNTGSEATHYMKSFSN